MTVPLQLVDNFLLNYHVGHVLTLLFGLMLLGMVVVRSWKILGLNLVLFGVIFLATPASVLGGDPMLYKMFGVLLMLFGPMVYTVLAR